MKEAVPVSRRVEGYDVACPPAPVEGVVFLEVPFRVKVDDTVENESTEFLVLILQQGWDGEGEKGGGGKIIYRCPGPFVFLPVLLDEFTTTIGLLEISIGYAANQ